MEVKTKFVHVISIGRVALAFRRRKDARLQSEMTRLILSRSASALQPACV